MMNKIKYKTGGLLIALGLLTGAQHVNAGCNNGNALRVSLSGAAGVEVGSTNKYTATITATGTSGDYQWTHTGFDVPDVPEDTSTTSGTIYLIAPNEESLKENDKEIKCEFVPDVGDAVGCDTKNVTVVKSDFIYLGIGDGADASQGYVEEFFDTLDEANYDEDKDVWIYEDLSKVKRSEVKFITTKSDFIEALEKEDAYVSFNGHSNYGLGLAFNSFANTPMSLLKIGDDRTGISWEGLRSHFPNFMYASLTVSTNPVNYVTGTGFDRFDNVTGTYNSINVPYVDVTPPDNVFNVLYNGVMPNCFHYLANSEGEGGELTAEPYVIVERGSSDMPSAGYKWFMLSSCNSALYNGDNLSDGANFLTDTFGWLGSEDQKHFVQAIIADEDEEQLLSRLNVDDDVEFSIY